MGSFPQNIWLQPKHVQKYISLLRSTQGVEPPGDLNTPLDLHSKDGQFCVDISDFLDLEWVEKEVEECETVFEKSCEEKTQNVCLTVNETLCEVSAKCIYSSELVEKVLMKPTRRRP